ncbi:MAG: TIGR03032 family protein [Actinobacteria bacterium]|uniref:Unannotated protein n=1 Tax=freshwater metagenome TaxID=449393 RepID=A0A6J7J8B3_9ZZZZ|nr:TIGR03032 family protein [Actinomycetota bacterium]
MAGADLIALGSVAASEVVVLRDPRTAVGALMSGWGSGRFAIDPQPEGWWGDRWSFTLIDGWQELVGQPLAVVCARQWLTLQLAAMRASAPDSKVTSFEELVADPRAAEARLSAELGGPVRIRVEMAGDPWKHPQNLSEVRAGLDANAGLLEEYFALVDLHASTSASAGDWVTGYREPLPEAQRPPAEVSQPSTGTRFHSEFTASMPELLAATGTSLLITTYKSGHAIIARTPDGVGLDTYFTSLDRPMGAAVAGNRVAIGAADSVVVYARHDVGASLGIEPVPDAVLVPKAIVFTGDVSIHDMAWDDDGTLWFVNTSFSCLSTLQPYASFDCSWKPSWISGLAAEDRCHLNGLASRDGRPRYVTALARTNTPGGWRDQRGTGGVIVDITTDEVIATGLCMPHSPRWHNGRMWFLQSGTGTLHVLDPGGQPEEVCALPGFTRGLTFLGPYAVVGLSQVRESVFTGLPITDTASERNCGVWIIDTRTGQHAGHLRFTSAVSEIFDVHPIPARWPHIADPGELSRSCFVLDPQTLPHLER